MSLFGSAVWAAATMRNRQLTAHARDPRPCQERALRRLLKRAANTAFGRIHDLGRVRTIQDYRAALPVHRYADLEPWFLRALDGEPDVVWPGLMPYFAWSSGTTAGRKYLPLSMDTIRQQQRGGFDPIACYLRATGDRSLFDGKSLLLGGSSALEQRPSGVKVGVNTGIMANHIPAIARRSQLPSMPVRCIADWDDKVAAMARESVDEDVRLIAACPSWLPGFFDEVLRVARARGRRAEVLREVWPELRLIVGGGMNYQPYRALIESRVGAAIPYLETYNATEGGILGVNDRLDQPHMLIVPDNGLYYEFVEAAEFERPNAERLSLWEVELGVVYAVVVTTMSGIFSYAIGDCIRFTGTFPHRFVFEGRIGGWMNVAGELLSQGEIERAVRRACQKTGQSIAEFTVAADIGFDETGAARHVYLIEGATVAHGPDLTEGCLGDLALAIDADLRQCNGDYDAHRQLAASLLAPVVRTVPEGTFHDWMRARGKLGEQFKVPRILLDPSERARFEAVAAGLSQEVSP